MTKQLSMGMCELCGENFGKAVMTRHLTKCSQVQTPAPPGKQKITPAFHLVVEGRWAKAYWLHLAVPVKAPLSKLDGFLRHIWLECCGHLSAFEIDGISYNSHTGEEAGLGGMGTPLGWLGMEEEERGMETPLGRVVNVGTKFSYQYDFGSTTELGLRVVGPWNQFKPKDGVQLLARNEPPQIICLQCKTQPATLICTECGEAWLCQTCAAGHECGEEMRLPVVNSPRVGVCAYTG